MDDYITRGVPWTLLSYGCTKVITVATTVVLARLLVPADFGLFTLATLATGFVSLFSGLGVGTALVLRQDLDPRQQGTVLTMLVGAGAVFAAALAGAAPLIARAFNEPRLTSVLLALAGYLSFTGVNWFYESLFQREMLFRRRFVSEGVRTVVFSGVALTAAGGFDEGVWALVIAQAAAHVANGLALWRLAPYRVRFAWDPHLASELLRTGSGFVLQDVAAFLEQNADYLTTGRLLGSSSLGIYSMAYRQADLPYQAIAEPMIRVTFPAFARRRHEGEAIGGTYLASLRLLALITVPLGTVLSAAAAPFVHALFGDRWLGMIGPLGVLGLWAAIRPLNATVTWLLNSMCGAGAAGRVSLLMLIPLVPGLIIGAQLGGVTGVAYAMFGHATVWLVVVTRLAHRMGGPSPASHLAILWPLLVGGSGAWAASRFTAIALAHIAAFPALVLAAVAGVAAYLGLVALLDRAVLGYAWSAGRGAIKGSQS